MEGEAKTTNIIQNSEFGFTVSKDVDIKMKQSLLTTRRSVFMPVLNEKLYFYAS